MKGLRIRPATPDDWPRIATIRRLAFRWAGEPDVLLPGMWVLADQRGVHACARMEAEAQWFGGRSVPAALLSSVAVAIESRGQGVGGMFLGALLHEARAAGLGTVTLFPSAIRPYRRAGFEIAGSHVTLALDTRDLPRARDGDMTVEPVDVAEVTSLAATYDRFAAARNGPVARSDSWWRTRTLSSRPPTPREEPDLAAFVARHDGQVRGYVLFTQSAAGDGRYGGRLECRDLVWLDARAARALLAIAGGSGPLLGEIRWPGTIDDPLGALIDTPPRVVEVDPWMTRVLDAEAAIAARGYPAHVTADLRLRVEDPVEPAWGRSLRIRVAEGRASVAPDTGPAPTLDVGTLSAILAGSLAPSDAARLGRLDASDADIVALSALSPFGPRWIGDRF